jgi:hypothetical protein
MAGYVIEESKWYAWDGGKWSADQSNPYARAEEVARGIHIEAANCQDA